MNTTAIGTQPVGTAKGDERWATITEDDQTLRVTAYRGWGILDEVALTGPNAECLADAIADMLVKR
jgi:hypothetical protein